MKRILGVLTITFACVGFAAFSQAEESSWTGYLSDASCAKNYEKSSADHAACAKACVKRGGDWALAMKEAFHVLDIDAETADAHAGHHVVIKGTLDEETNTIKVSSLEMAK